MLELFRQMLDDHLGKAEFLTAFKGVIDQVKAFESKLTKDFSALTETISRLAVQAKGDTQEAIAAFRAQVSEFLDGERSRIDAKLAEIDEKLSTVHNGQDADAQVIKDAVLAELDLPDVKEQIVDTPIDVRNKLDLLASDEQPQAIVELREEIEKLKKDRVRGGIMGGTMGLSIGHQPLHQAFTMNGSDTSVSLTQGGVGAFGNACFVRYQGQLLDHSVQYTVDGNKITLVGFTPESGTIISVTYWP